MGMHNTSPSAKKKSTSPTGPSDAQTVEDEIKALLASLPEVERASVMKRVTRTLPPDPNPRAGPVLEAVVNALPSRGERTVAEIKDAVEAQGVMAKPKEIYNAITYLARRGQIKQVGYSRYLIVDEGAGVTTTDNLGIEPKEDGE